LKRISIAIDGHSSCGKSTLAKALAKVLSYSYIDTGAMYRAITVLAMQNKLFGSKGIDETKLKLILQDLDLEYQYNPETQQVSIYLNGTDVTSYLRLPETASKVSEISKLVSVRQKLQQLQRNMAQNKGVIMDGRDIAAKIMPDAELKIFLTAQPQIRAQRRYDELKGSGVEITFDEVFKNLQERDYIDSNRKDDPLIKVSDAIEIDNSQINPEKQLDLVLRLVNERL
jgi:cytidylate kinase